jgi:hypothetical protein
MKSTLKKLILALCVWMPCTLLAQEEKDEPFVPKIRGAIMMANSHVPSATQGGKEVIIIPMWGFDVFYSFHKRWSIGIQTDVKLQSFEVEDENQLALSRSFPVSLALIGQYRAFKHVSFYLGPGIEIEKSRNLFMVKAGLEYNFEISEQFEIGLGLIYENRAEVYDGYSFGITFSKKLWEKK